MFGIRIYSCLFAGLLGFQAAASSPVTFTEDFSVDPVARGWKATGGLFTWNGLDNNLRVTWDSSKPNSYFYRSLGDIITKDDDFELGFDLQLDDIATQAKSGPFEIAIGLSNIADATRSEFWRGSGVNDLHGPRNLVEFDYFPAGYYPGWGSVDPSVSPTLVSSENKFASGFSMLQLTNGALYHVTLSFTSSNQTLHTAVTCNGAAVGQISDVKLPADFGNFRLDTLAISSYSDAGDDYDSVLAHGTLDNIVITTPVPPVWGLTGQLQSGIWQCAFTSRINWSYVLERASTLGAWSAVSGPIAGTGEVLRLEDQAPPNDKAFYRVSARRL